MPPKKKQQPKPAPFKLFHLPILALEEIVSNLNFIQILYLSLCSEKSRQIIRILYKTPAIRLEVKIDKNEKQILIHSKDVELFWIFYRFYKSQRRTREMKKFGGMLIDTSMPISNNNNRGPLQFITFGTPTNLDLNMNAVLSHLFNTFPKAQTTEVIVDFNCLWATFRVSKALNAVKKTEILHLQSECGNREVQYLLPNIEVTRVLCYDSSTYQGVTVATKLNCSERIFCRNSRWMCPESLWNLNCKYISLYNTRFTSKDIEEFFRRWKDSVGDEMTNIDQVYIDIPFGEALSYDNLEAAPWDETVEPRGSEFEGQGGKGMDIRRTDGRIGTIFQYGDTILNFLVYCPAD